MLPRALEGACRKLVVSGHSAGGHPCCLHGGHLWEAYGAPPDLIRACLSVSGLFDLRPLLATPLNVDLKLTAATATAASPLLWPMSSHLVFDSWVGRRRASNSCAKPAPRCRVAGTWAAMPLWHGARRKPLFVIGGLARPDHPDRRLAGTRQLRRPARAGTGRATSVLTEAHCLREVRMARKLMKIGGLYLAYEITSTAVLAAAVAYGFNIPGF